MHGRNTYGSSWSIYASWVGIYQGVTDRSTRLLATKRAARKSRGGRGRGDLRSTPYVQTSNRNCYTCVKSRRGPQRIGTSGQQRTRIFSLTIRLTRRHSVTLLCCLIIFSASLVIRLWRVTSHVQSYADHISITNLPQAIPAELGDGKAVIITKGANKN